MDEENLQSNYQANSFYNLSREQEEILIALKKELSKIANVKRSVGITNGVLLSISEINKLLNIKDEDNIFDNVVPKKITQKST